MASSFHPAWVAFERPSTTHARPSSTVGPSAKTRPEATGAQASAESRRLHGNASMHSYGNPANNPTSRATRHASPGIQARYTRISNGNNAAPSSQAQPTVPPSSRPSSRASSPRLTHSDVGSRASSRESSPVRGSYKPASAPSVQARYSSRANSPANSRAGTTFLEDGAERGTARDALLAQEQGGAGPSGN